MWTTIRLADQLLRSTKRFAHETRQSLAKLIEDALRHTLARRAAKQVCSQIRLTTVSGHGLRAGVNIDDSAAFLALIERPQDYS